MTKWTGGAVALGLAASAAVAWAQPAGAPAPAAIRAGSDALIAASGGAAADFAVVPDYHLMRVRHIPSGLVCAFPVGGTNRIELRRDSGGDTLACSARSGEMTETWTVQAAAPAVARTAQFGRWTDSLVASGAARVAASDRGVDTLPIVRKFGARLAAERSTGWLVRGPEAGNALVYYGVADAGGWRVTYQAEGKPDAVRMIAPMVWLTGLDGMAGRRPLVNARAL